MNVEDIIQERIFHWDVAEHGKLHFGEIKTGLSGLGIGDSFVTKVRSLARKLWTFSLRIMWGDESKIQGLLVSVHQDRYFVTIIFSVGESVFTRIQEDANKVNSMEMQEVIKYICSLPGDFFAERAKWRHREKVEDLMMFKHKSKGDIIVNYKEKENGRGDLYVSVNVPLG